jgi:hypothetical protein
LAKAFEKALQRATTAEARATKAKASLTEVRGKAAQAESDLTTEREEDEGATFRDFLNFSEEVLGW